MFKSECTITFETSAVMQTVHEANSFHNIHSNSSSALNHTDSFNSQLVVHQFFTHSQNMFVFATYATVSRTYHG